MSQADSARIEALEAQVREQDERISELEEQVASLRKLAEGDDLMPVVYPETIGPKPGRRSG